MYECHFISWYVFGSSSLTSLPIFTQQQGKKTQWYTEKCDLLSETTFLLYWNLWQCGVFSFTKVCVFLPMVFVIFSIRTLCFYVFCITVMFSIRTLCFYVFCKTVLVKNAHLAKVWFDFPLPNAIIVTLAFMWYFNYTIKAH